MIPWVYTVSKNFSSFLFRPLFRLRVVGAENVPETGPVLFVANHASYLDPVLLGCRLRRPVRFMARRTLEQIPLFGHWVRWLGCIFVDREGDPRDAIEGCVQVLARGDMSCVFAEGTRTRDGRLAPFKNGLRLILRRAVKLGTEVQVVPVAIKGSYRAMPRGRFLPLPVHIEVEYGTAIAGSSLIGRDAADQLRARVASMLGEAESKSSSMNPAGESGSSPASPGPVDESTASHSGSST